MSEDFNPELESALREYEKISELSRDSYQFYIKCIIFTGIAGGAILTAMLTIIKNVNGATNSLNDILGISGIIGVILINIWIASWAYLNLELWAHRNYLKNLEEFISLKFKKTEKPENFKKQNFNFYRTSILGMYSESKDYRIPSFMLLNFSFYFALLIVYSFALYLAFMFGFAAISKPFECKSPSFAELMRDCFPYLFAGISLICIFATIQGKKLIEKNFKGNHINKMPNTKMKADD